MTSSALPKIFAGVRRHDTIKPVLARTLLLTGLLAPLQLVGRRRILFIATLSTDLAGVQTGLPAGRLVLAPCPATSDHHHGQKGDQHNRRLLCNPVQHGGYYNHRPWRLNHSLHPLALLVVVPARPDQGLRGPGHQEWNWGLHGVHGRSRGAKGRVGTGNARATPAAAPHGQVTWTEVRLSVVVPSPNSPS